MSRRDHITARRINLLRNPSKPGDAISYDLRQPTIR